MRWSAQAWAAAAAAALAVAAVPVAGAHFASASATPAVAWHFASASVTAGVAPSLTYTVTAMPYHGRVDVQRQSGTSWLVLAHLTPSSRGTGSYRPPGVPLGRYTYRLVVRNSSGKAVAATAHVLLSYGTVGLAAVMGRTAQTAPVGSASYSYVWGETGWAGKAELFLPRTSCRSMRLTMGYVAPASSAANTATIATLTLSERGINKTANVTSGSVGVLSSALTGQALQIGLANAPGSLYGNGTASCWTKNGRY